MKYQSFDQWMDETEGAETRGQQIIRDIKGNEDAATLAWLRIAFELGAAAEREACAKIADEQSDPLGSRDVYDQVAARTAARIADAIRERGDT